MARREIGIPGGTVASLAVCPIRDDPAVTAGKRATFFRFMGPAVRLETAKERPRFPARLEPDRPPARKLRQPAGDGARPFIS